MNTSVVKQLLDSVLQHCQHGWVATHEFGTRDVSDVLFRAVVNDIQSCGDYSKVWALVETHATTLYYYWNHIEQLEVLPLPIPSTYHIGCEHAFRVPFTYSLSVAQILLLQSAQLLGGVPTVEREPLAQLLQSIELLEHASCTTREYIRSLDDGSERAKQWFTHSWQRSTQSAVPFQQRYLCFLVRWTKHTRTYLVVYDVTSTEWLVLLLGVNVNQREVFRSDPQTASKLPRLRALSFPSAHACSDCLSSLVQLESGLPIDTLNTGYEFTVQFVQALYRPD